MVTLYDVARLAGVSTATVSRVVHGQDRVRESTRTRVREVIEQLGYVPDGAAQSLSRRRKEIVGIVAVERETKQNDIENMNLLYYDEIVRGVASAIRERGWSLLIHYVRCQEEWDFPRLQSLTGKVDGLLMVEGVVPAALARRLAQRVPIVVIGGAVQERALDVVAVDNRAGSAALITHLVADHGRRRLFHVDGPSNVGDVQQRRLALQHVVRAHPDSQVMGCYPGNFSVQSGVNAGEMLLARRAEGLPDAVVCANDQMAIGVLQALMRAGVNVPKDVAVAGFDDIYPGSLSAPPLTTVHQPMQLLGERACTRLLERIATPGLRQRVEMLPTELVLRASCGCPPGTATRLPVA